MGSLNKMFLFIVSWLGVSLDQIISYVVHLVCQFIRVSHFVHYASAFWILQRESSFMVFLSHPNLLLILKFFFFFFFLDMENFPLIIAFFQAIFSFVGVVIYSLLQLTSTLRLSIMCLLAPPLSFSSYVDHCMALVHFNMLP